MTPRAELVHWAFAAGFLLLGLILLAEAIVGNDVFAMRRWRDCTRQVSALQEAARQRTAALARLQQLSAELLQAEEHERMRLAEVMGRRLVADQTKDAADKRRHTNQPRRSSNPLTHRRWRSRFE